MMVWQTAVQGAASAALVTATGPGQQAALSSFLRAHRRHHLRLLLLVRDLTAPAPLTAMKVQGQTLVSDTRWSTHYLYVDKVVVFNTHSLRGVAVPEFISVELQRDDRPRDTV